MEIYSLCTIVAWISRSPSYQTSACESSSGNGVAKDHNYSDSFVVCVCVQGRSVTVKGISFCGNFGAGSVGK